MSRVASTTTATAADRMAGLADGQPGVQTLNVRKETVIQAPLDIVWESLLEEMGPAGEMPDGSKMPPS